jgi:hypothetical protein
MKAPAPMRVPRLYSTCSAPRFLNGGMAFRAAGMASSSKEMTFGWPMGAGGCWFFCGGISSGCFGGEGLLIFFSATGGDGCGACEGDPSGNAEGNYDCDESLPGHDFAACCEADSPDQGEDQREQPGEDCSSSKCRGHGGWAGVIWCLLLWPLCPRAGCRRWRWWSPLVRRLLRG